MPRPIWISRELAIALHQRQLAEHGGLDGIRDSGMLDSALARPRNLFAYSDSEPDLAQLAAAYAFGIARNHPFIDGNKRTAYVVARSFLIRNGKDLSVEHVEQYRMFLALAEGSVTEEALAEWMRRQLTSRDPDRLN